MPSPLGHALGGLAAGWLLAGPPDPRAIGQGPSAARQGSKWRRLPPRALAFGVLGMAPDLDLLIGRHSGFTHSIGIALFVGLAAYAVLRFALRAGMAFRTPGAPPSASRALAASGDPRLLAVAAAAAYASHILLDWLGADATPPLGIAALWPFSSSYFVSGLDIFWGISREPWRPGAAWHDVLAVSREVLLLGPLAWAAWWLRRSAPRRILPDARLDGRQQLPTGSVMPPDGESQR